MNMTAVLVGGRAVNMVTADDQVCRHVHSDGAYEPQTLACWAELCAAGDSVADVGAYTGLFTIAARQRGCACWAFEPMSANRNRMRLNCRLNGVDWHVDGTALSDKAGTVTLHHNKTPLTSGASMVKSGIMSTTVACATLDSFHIERLSAIKIDAERADHLVLRGARDTLARLRPTIIVEVLDTHCGDLIAAEVPKYRVEREMDRNWLMVPR